MNRLRHGSPVWLDQGDPIRRFPSHRGHLDVDVVIIGGGITGSICAYLFSEAGLDVALVESRRVARGSTVASTALLMQEPDRDFADLAQRFGRSAARQIWLSLGRATRELARTIRALKLDCDLQVRDSVYFTRDLRKLAGLRAEFDARKAAGVRCRWLSAEALHRFTGITAPGGIATPGNAEMNPLRACHGFLAAAVDRGARVFERSPAGKVTTSRQGVTVQTGRGVIAARVVVIATGYARPRFERRLGRVTLKDTYVIATRRLPLRLRRQIPAFNAMAWDTDRPYHYLRWTQDGRLLVGGGDTNHRAVKGSRARIARARVRLRSYLAEIYPALAAERPAYSWEGLFAETPDGLPYIGTHSRYPRHLFALGYGGNGMTASYLAAKLLLEKYRALDAPAAGSRRRELFAFNRGRG
jgi:glycine/D-amino acid oxidase-like deaminating enzyme